MMPRLKAHSFYQLTQGNISIWSTPWCTGWATIHDYLIIQQPGFRYPSSVRELWLPGQKTWNQQMVQALFSQPMAVTIMQTDIIEDDAPDLLSWDLTPNGVCSSKSAYKLCLQDIHSNPRDATLALHFGTQTSSETSLETKTNPS